MLKNKTIFDTWIVTNEEDFKKNKKDLLSKKLPIMFSDDEDSYYDEVGGYHSCGTGWNPNGMWCGECGRLSCSGCSSEHKCIKTFLVVAKDEDYPEVRTTIEAIDLQHAKLEAFNQYPEYHEIGVWEWEE